MPLAGFCEKSFKLSDCVFVSVDAELPTINPAEAIVNSASIFDKPTKDGTDTIPFPNSPSVVSIFKPYAIKSPTSIQVFSSSLISVAPEYLAAIFLLEFLL